MMKKLVPIVAVCFFLVESTYVHAQGCSDAGVCSAGALGLETLKYEKLPLEEFKLNPIEIDSNENVVNSVKDSTSHQSSSSKNSKTIISGWPKFILSYKTIYGRGDNQTNIFTQQFEAMYFLYKNKLIAQLKLPYQTVNGDLGNNAGIGDITASLSYSITNKVKKALSIVGGVKIPVNNADASINTLALPMVYQTSLGTYDALFGFNYRIKSWDITAAYQHPFNSNKNQYLNDPSQSLIYNTYPESRNLKRADDAVLRLNKRFKVKKLSLSSGLLGIYHMADDQYESLNGQNIDIKGSKGLTLNVNLSSIYPISKKLDLMAIYAQPLIIRDARPAGLTRSYVFMLGVRLKTFKK